MYKESSHFNWLTDDFALAVRTNSEALALERLGEAAKHMNLALDALKMKQAKDKEEVGATSDQLAQKKNRCSNSKMREFQTRLPGRNQKAMGRVVRAGLMPGALYGAELADYSKTDIAMI